MGAEKTQALDRTKAIVGMLGGFCFIFSSHIPQTQCCAGASANPTLLDSKADEKLGG